MSQSDSNRFVDEIDRLYREYMNQILNVHNIAPSQRAKTQSSTTHQNDQIQDFGFTSDVRGDSMPSYNGLDATGQYRFPDGEVFKLREMSSQESERILRPVSPIHRQVLAGCKRKRLQDLQLGFGNEQGAEGQNRSETDDRTPLGERSCQQQSINKPIFLPQPHPSGQDARSSQSGHTGVIEVSYDDEPAPSIKRQKVNGNFADASQSSGYPSIGSPGRGSGQQIHPTVTRAGPSSSRPAHQRIGTYRRQAPSDKRSRGTTPSRPHPELNNSSSHGHGQLSVQHTTPRRQTSTSTRNAQFPKHTRTPLPSGAENYSSDTDSRGSYPYRAENYQPGLPSKLRTSQSFGAEHNLPSNSSYESDSFVQYNTHQSSYKHPETPRANSYGKQPAARQTTSGVRGSQSTPRQLQGSSRRHKEPELRRMAMSKRKRQEVIEISDSESEDLRTTTKRHRSLSPGSLPKCPQATLPDQPPNSPKIQPQVSGPMNAPGHISRSVRNKSGTVFQNGEFQQDQVFDGKFYGNEGYQENWGCQEHGGYHWNAGVGVQAHGGFNNSPIGIGADIEAPIGSAAPWRHSQVVQPFTNTPHQAKATAPANPSSHINGRSRLNPQSQVTPPSRVSIPEMDFLSQVGPPQYINSSQKANTSNVRKRTEPPHVAPFTGAPSGYKPAPYNQPSRAHQQRLPGSPTPSLDQAPAADQLPQSSLDGQDQQYYQLGYSYPQGTPYQHQRNIEPTTSALSYDCGSQGQSQVTPNPFEYTIHDSPQVSNLSATTSSVVKEPETNQFGVGSPAILPTVNPDDFGSLFASSLADIPAVANNSVNEPIVLNRSVIHSDVVEPDAVEPNILTPDVVKPYSIGEPDDVDHPLASPPGDHLSATERSQVDETGEAASYDHSIETAEFVPWCEDDLRYVTPYLEHEKIQISKSLKYTRNHYLSILGEEPPQTSRDLTYAEQWGELQAALASRWLGPAPVPNLFALEPLNSSFTSWSLPPIEEVNGRLQFCYGGCAGMDLSEDAFKYYGDPYESDWSRHWQEDVGSRKPIKDPWGLWDHVASYSYSEETDAEALGAEEAGELPADDQEFHGFVETESLDSGLGDDDAVADREDRSKPE